MFAAAGSITDTVAATTGCDTIRTINVITSPLLTTTIDTAVCVNSFPATILGHLFTTPGTIIDTVSSVAGCDTIRTINVTTLPLLTITIDTAICVNSFPATILGHVFAAPGSIVDTVSSVTGCDTIRTINVTTLPLLTTTIDTAICVNGFPATILGHVFTTPGTIIDTVSSVAGCDMIRTINVTTLPLLTTTIDTTVCANSFPVTILGHVFAAPGSITDTVTATTGCDTIRTINVTSLPLQTITIDTAVCASSFPATILGHVFAAPGSITDTVTATTGCDTIRTINVTTLPLLTTTIDTAVCVNSFPATILGHVFAAPGSIIDTVSSVAGCDTIRTINVTTLPLLTTTIDTAVCVNSFPATILGHVFAAPGSIIDTVSSVAGCDTIRTINVTTLPLQTITIDTAVCASSFPATILGHVFTTPGTITDTVSSIVGCDTIRTINVTTLPLLSIAIDTAVCVNSFPATILGHVFTTPGTITDTITATTGCDTIRTINVTTLPLQTITIDTAVCASSFPATILGHVFAAPGSITDTVTATMGCDTIRTINVTTLPLQTITIDTAVCASSFPATILGHVFAAPGSIADTVAATTGCDTIRTINVTTLPLLTTTIDTAVCVNSFPATILGHVFTVPGSVIDTVAAATGCDTIRTINVTTLPLLTTTIDTAVCANAYPATILGHVFTAPGTITDTVTVTTGCDTIRTINVTTLPLQTITIDTAVCVNSFPATILGHVFTVPGSVIDTVAAATGCDTIRTINVTTLPLQTITIDTAVCASSFPATILGHVFTVPGAMIDTVTATTGCDTIRTINVTALPLLTTTIDTVICINSFPATILGHVFAALGSITDTVSSVAGCDTIRTINVTTLPLLTIAIDTVVCANAYPVTILGHVFAAPGTVVDTVVATTGCDTIRTINVTTLPLLTTTLDTTVCTGQLPFIWNGNPYNMAGTYLDTLISTTGGCDTIATLNLVVNAAPITPTVVITDATCAAPGIITITAPLGTQYSYSIDGITFQPNNIFTDLAPGVYIITVMNVNGCTATATVTINQVNNTLTLNQIVVNAICDASNGAINLSVNGTGTAPFTYSWTGPGEFTSTTEDISNLAAGSYNVVVTDANGCSASATVTIAQVNNTITLNQTVADAVCSSSNGSIDLTVSGIGTAPFTYTWTGPAGYTATTEDISNLAPGSYTVTVTDVNGCSATKTITVNQLLSSPNLVTHPATSCSPVNLTAAAITTGSDAGLTLTYWMDAAATIPLNNPSVVTSGVYYIKATTANGCSTIKPVTVTIAVAPLLIVTNPAAVCSGSVVDLTAPGITAGSDAGLTLAYWNNAAGTNMLANPNTIAISGTYYISAVNASGCKTIAPVTFMINQPVTSSFTGGATICPGQSTMLTITFSGSAPFSFTYTNGTNSFTVNGITTSTYQFAVSPLVTTTYTLTNAGNASCSNTINNLSELVVVVQVLQPMRYPTVTAVANMPVQLFARNLGNGYTYQWNPPEGLNNYTVFNPVFNYDRQKEYIITITSPSGCIVIDTLLVTMDIQSPTGIECDLFVPKAWSPNGDGHNDKLYPLMYGMKELKYFRIFNRWGQLVFETNVMGLGWDGIFKGMPQPMDTYTWTVLSVCESGRIIKRDGNAVLLR
ncbi:MAG TPA: gliding motility-associated C-terminal domain-containing protein [Chitinophagaceae bacterium]